VTSQGLERSDEGKDPPDPGKKRAHELYHAFRGIGNYEHWPVQLPSQDSDDLVTKEGGTSRYRLSEKGALALDFLGKFKAASSWSKDDPQQIKVPNTPFTRTSRVLQLALLAEILAVLFVNLYAYFTLPSIVPLQYELNGRTFATAPKSIFLLFAVVFNISQVVFLSLSVFQYPVVRRQMNSPSYPPFRTYLSKVSYEMRGYWINRYFSPIMAIGVVVGLLMIVLSLSFYQSVISSNGAAPVEIIIATLAIVLVSTVVLVNYMRGYVKRLDNESKN